MGGLSKDPLKRKKQLANLKKFKKGVSGNPDGKPRQTISSVVAELEEKGCKMPTPTEIAKVYFYIATLQESELKEVLADKELPMMTRIIAKGVLDKKGLDVLNSIVDRAFGKQQHIDITTNGKDLHQEPLKIEIIDSASQVDKKEDNKE